MCEPCMKGCQQNPWIATKDRLPDKSDFYFVATPIIYSTGRKDYIYSVIDFSAKHQLFCCSDRDNIEKREDGYPYSDVEWWMPIPEIHKEVE